MGYTRSYKWPFAQRNRQVTNQPYITFVTYFRNDNYTSDFALRVKRATGCLVSQLQRSTLEAEIILVEWNPPAERPLIIDSLDLPPSGGNVTVRAVVVDGRYHQNFLGAQERGMHAAAAANVGLRRARGRFVTPKASDTYVSNVTIATIARGDLEDGAIYRCDRYDVVLPTTTLETLDDEALLSHLEHLQGVRLSRLEQPEMWKIRDLHTNACGDFILMSRVMWQRVRGYPFDRSVLSLDCDSLVMHAAAALGLHEICLPASCRIIKAVHSHLFPNRINAVWLPWQSKLDAFFAKHDWRKLQHLARTNLDYPRRRVRGIDSVIGPSVERNFVKPAQRWARGIVPGSMSPENWGLADEPLEERILSRAVWDTPASASAA